MKHHAGMTPGELIGDCGDKARGERGDASDPHFPCRRVGEKLDALHAWRRSSKTAIPQPSNSVGSTPWRWRSSKRTPNVCSPVPRSIAKRWAAWCSGATPPCPCCRPAERHQEVQVVQLHPASDAIAQLHGGTRFRI